MSCRDNFKSDEQNVTEDLNQDNGKLGHNVFFVYYSLIISSQQLSYQYCYTALKLIGINCEETSSELGTTVLHIHKYNGITLHVLLFCRR